MADKKPQKSGASYSMAHLYENVGGVLKRTNRSCPKCGQGFFMAKHSSRWTCGKCKYTEFLSSAAKVEAK